MGNLSGMPRKKQYYGLLRHGKHSRCLSIAETKSSLMSTQTDRCQLHRKKRSVRWALEEMQSYKSKCLHLCHGLNPSLGELLQRARTQRATFMVWNNHLHSPCWTTPVFETCRTRTRQKRVPDFPQHLIGLHLFVLISHKFICIFLFQVCHTAVRRIMILLTKGILSKPLLSSLLVPWWP